MEIKPNARIVGAYTLIERRGSGGFGEVWKAHASGGFEVALKFIRLDFESFQQGSPEFRSLDVIRNIRHIHLLTPNKAFRHEDYLILEMELADDNLLDRLRAARGQGQPGIPVPDLLRWMGQAAEGLDYLNGPNHVIAGRVGARVQHRDVKPQNILVMQGGVKVADFSLARLLEGKTSNQTGSMTVSYAAPEFFDRITSEHSDQYSLGVSYVQLRIGQLPFTGTEAQIMAGHLTRPPDLGAIPQAEQIALRRALAKSPQDRFGSCREFVQALNQASNHARSIPVASPPQPRPNPNPQPQPRPAANPWDPPPPTPSPRPLYRVNPAANPNPSPSPARTPAPAPNPTPRPVPALAPTPTPISYHPPQPPPSPFPAAQPSPPSISPAPPTQRPAKPSPPSISLELDDDQELPLDSTLASPSRRKANAKMGSGSALRWMIALGALSAITIVVLLVAAWRRGNGPPAFAGAKEQGDFWYQRYEFDKAIVSYAKAIESSPSADAYAARALTYFRLNKDRMAFADSEEALRRDDRCVLALAVRGAARPFGQRAEAMADHARALQLDSSSSAAHTLHGITLRFYGEFGPSHEALAKAMRYAPDDLWPLANDAIAYNAEQRYDKAIELLSQAIQRDGSYYLAYLRRADSYRFKGDWDSAMRDYDEAVERGPNSYHTHHDRGFARQLRKDSAGALDDFANAIRVAPNSAVAHAARGDLYWELMRYEEAAQDYARAVNLEPEHRPYQLSLTTLYVLSAKEQVRQGRPEKADITFEMAETTMRGVLRARPAAQSYRSRLSEVLIDRGEFFEARGQWDRAAVCYRQAVELGSDRGGSHLMALLEAQPRLAGRPDELASVRARMPRLGWITMSPLCMTMGSSEKSAKSALIAKSDDAYVGDDPFADEWRRLSEDEQAIVPESLVNAMRDLWRLSRRQNVNFVELYLAALERLKQQGAGAGPSSDSDAPAAPAADAPIAPIADDDSVIREKEKE